MNVLQETAASLTAAVLLVARQPEGDRSYAAVLKRVRRAGKEHFEQEAIVAKVIDQISGWSASATEQARIASHLRGDERSEGGPAMSDWGPIQEQVNRILSLLRLKIKERGFTQLEVQEALGWGRSYISLEAFERAVERACPDLFAFVAQRDHCDRHQGASVKVSLKRLAQLAGKLDELERVWCRALPSGLCGTSTDRRWVRGFKTPKAKH